MTKIFIYFLDILTEINPGMGKVTNLPTPPARRTNPGPLACEASSELIILLTYCVCVCVTGTGVWGLDSSPVQLCVALSLALSFHEVYFICRRYGGFPGSTVLRGTDVEEELGLKVITTD